MIQKSLMRIGEWNLHATPPDIQYVYKRRQLAPLVRVCGEKPPVGSSVLLKEVSFPPLGKGGYNSNQRCYLSVTHSTLYRWSDTRSRYTNRHNQLNCYEVWQCRCRQATACLITNAQHPCRNGSLHTKQVGIVPPPQGSSKRPYLQEVVLAAFFSEVCAGERCSFSYAEKRTLWRPA